MGRKRASPEPFEVEITGLNKAGAGTTTHKDKALAVRGALPGERVMARNLFGRRVRGQAETLQVLTASAQRVTPPCSHFGTCSACSLQHIAPQAQLAIKQQQLSDALCAAGVKPATELAPLAAERWHYRRKARLSVRLVKGKGRVLVGFREHDGRFVTDMDSCETLYPLVADALPALSALIQSLDAADRVPQIEASCGDEEGALVIRNLDPLDAPDLDRLRAFEETSRLRIYLQPKGPDTVHPLSEGASRLRYTLPEEGLSFRFEPLDFVQVNNALNAKMVAQAMALLAPQPSDTALDLFCGLGNFTLPLARRCREVTGLEVADNLLERARANARDNGVVNAHFRAADLYGENIAGHWPAGQFDLVILDPPRSGAGPVLAHIAASGARRILYVSCNPETLAQDARVLSAEHGYELKAAGAMDMFPQTTHIEAMALFERDNGSPGGA